MFGLGVLPPGTGAAPVQGGGVYAAAMVGAALPLWAVPELVRLNIAAQATHAPLLPLAIGLLVALAMPGAAAG